MSRRTLVAALAAALAGCAGAPLQTVDSLRDVGSAELVLVGKIKLTPPLDKDEQVFKGVIMAYDARNKAFMILDDNYKEAEEEPSASDYGGRIEATLGRTFFVARERQPFYIRLGMITLEISRTAQKRAYLPGGFRVDVQPGDRAVYFGTIHYHRDEFFNVTQITVDDEYDEADGLFLKKFGSRIALRKALAVAVKKHKKD